MSQIAAPPMLSVLQGEAQARPPVWFMRQAGRYLPEYRALRQTAPDFIAFCLDPEKAAEATLQPLRRYPFDAAILFSDILVLPMALGQKVWFEAGEGPKLGDLPSIEAMLGEMDKVAEVLSPMGETLKRVRAALPVEKTLIGFAGAPWTIVTYMIEKGSSDRSNVRSKAYTDAALIDQLLGVVVEATARYLAMQAAAGAQVLQLFESWAEGLADDQFQRLVIDPHKALVARLRELGVTAPVIGFPRGAPAMLETYLGQVPVQGLGLDTTTPLPLGQKLQTRVAIQGALDPLLLRAGGAALDRRVDALLETWGRGRYIFNLGHGILPDTPMSHVEQVLKRIVEFKA